MKCKARVVFFAAGILGSLVLVWGCSPFRSYTTTPMSPSASPTSVWLPATTSTSLPPTQIAPSATSLPINATRTIPYTHTPVPISASTLWVTETAVAFPYDLFSVENEESVSWPDSSLCADAIGGDTGDAPWRYYWRGRGAAPALVKDLALDGDWLWVATPKALLRIHRPTLACERLDESAGAPASHLADAVGLVVDAQGWLWVVGPNGLVRHRAGEWQVLSKEEMWGFALDVEGDIWRVNLRHGRRWIYYDATCLASNSTGDDENMIISRDCGHWRVLLAGPLRSEWGLGGYKYVSLDECQVGQSRYARSSVEHNDLLANWPYDTITVLAADDTDDGVWIGTYNGLAYSDGEAVSLYALFNNDYPLSTPFWFRSIAATADGRVWASGMYGLVYFDETRLVVGSIPDASWSQVTSDGRGGMWLLKKHVGRSILAHYDAGVWRAWWVPQSRHCSFDFLTSVNATVASDEVWLADKFCGLARFDGQTWYLLKWEVGFVREFLLAPGGEVYRRLEDKLQVFDEKTWRPVPGIDLLELSFKALLAADAQGGIWLSAGKRVYYLHKSVQYDVHYPGGDIRSALLDSRGWLWVGAKDGVWRYVPPARGGIDGGEWELVGPHCDAYCVGNRVLMEDSQGRIWVGDYGFKMTDPAAWGE